MSGSVQVELLVTHQSKYSIYTDTLTNSLMNVTWIQNIQYLLY